MSSSPPAAFTVVIPAYDAGSMLREALESVAAQTVRPAWVVVIDDGSSDGTAAAATGWLAGFGLPGQVIRQENQGISAARNAGLAARRTQTIALLDADDLWLPNHLRNLTRAYAAFPDAVVAFGDSRFFGDPRSRTDLLAARLALPLAVETRDGDVHRLGDDVFERSLPGQFFAISASSFRMDVGTPELRFMTDLPVGEDRYLFLQLARRGPFVYVAEQSCRTRRHATNTTHDTKDAWLREQGLRALAKIRADRSLALTAAELRIVEAAQRQNADALLYAASRDGVPAYLRARHTSSAYVGRSWSWRAFARALVASAAFAVGSRGSAKLPGPTNPDRH